MISVAIVEDALDVREGLRYLLSLDEGIQVLGAYESAELLLEDETVLSSADVVLMDIELAGMNGIRASRLLKERHPDLEILILTIFEEQEKIIRAVEAGATGYLLKNTAPRELIGQIKSAVRGGSPINPLMARKLIVEMQKKKDSTRRFQDYNLTQREKEVFRAIVEGYTYREIADNLDMASATAKKHILHIYQKLKVNSKVEFIKKVLDENLLEEL